jgi:acyl dehydratase
LTASSRCPTTASGGGSTTTPTAGAATTRWECRDLAPVLLGDGIRFFGELASAPVLLDDPVVV